MTTSIAPRAISNEQRSEIVRQIGMGNLLSISGGRKVAIADGVEFPVSNGYHVRVQLANDVYTVSRIFRRKVKGVTMETIKGQRTEVYCDQVSSAAYYCSCFRSYDAEEWVTRIA